MGCTFRDPPQAVALAFSERGRYDIDLQLSGDERRKEFCRFSCAFRMIPKCFSFATNFPQYEQRTVGIYSVTTVK
jgi:hypothetical protein